MFKVPTTAMSTLEKFDVRSTLTVAEIGKLDMMLGKMSELAKRIFPNEVDVVRFVVFVCLKTALICVKISSSPKVQSCRCRQND